MGQESSKRLVNRRALLAEKLCALLTDVETILESYPKLAVNHDRRFVAETHSDLNWSLVTAHKVGPFVSIQADAVARAMRQSGSFVIRTEARVSDHLARRGVY